MKSQEHTSRRILIGIIIAVVVWGLLLAVGAYLGMWHQAGPRGGLRDPRRFWIVSGMVALFLACWAVALAARARRTSGKDRRVQRSEHPRGNRETGK